MDLIWSPKTQLFQESEIQGKMRLPEAGVQVQKELVLTSILSLVRGFDGLNVFGVNRALEMYSLTYCLAGFFNKA